MQLNWQAKWHCRHSLSLSAFLSSFLSVFLPLCTACYSWLVSKENNKEISQHCPAKGKKDEIKPQRKQSRKFNLKLDRLPQRGSWATLQAPQQQQQLQPHDMYKNNKYIYIYFIYIVVRIRIYFHSTFFYLLHKTCKIFCSFGATAGCVAAPAAAAPAELRSSYGKHMQQLQGATLSRAIKWALISQATWAVKNLVKCCSSTGFAPAAAEASWGVSLPAMTQFRRTQITTESARHLARHWVSIEFITRRSWRANWCHLSTTMRPIAWRKPQMQHN